MPCLACFSWKPELLQLLFQFRRKTEEKKMGFLSLLVVASMPVLQLLLVSCLGAFLAYKCSDVFSDNVRRNMNKIVFAVFSPSLVFASLAKTVTLEELVTWWYMPINIGITFLIGGVLGWVAVKILRPARHLEGLIIANCSAGNLGNLMLMTIPAVCGEAGNPFGEKSTCSTRGLSYVSASMALGGFYIWTHTYSLIKKDGATYEMLVREGSVKKIANKSSIEEQPELSTEIGEDNDSQLMEPLLSSASSSGKMRTGEHIWRMVIGTFHELADELVEPPTVAAMAGFVVGAIPWLKSLIIGNNAPLRVIQDSAVLLGDGTLPCTTLILGGNLTRGIGKSAVKPSAILAIALVRYVALPISGIFVVRAAASLGFLPQDPLFSYVLLTQFTLPPAVAIEPLDRGQDCMQGYVSSEKNKEDN
ncbi:hypothetical protein HPP92_022535 [Vanilla planifolia]|uniref:Auxin efflux carrier family protein n=1 Tax=Vanilla planifolia TaxID=51239 RepID=A0A835PR30_VANPL|nr:hypothetical protein HPP92_022535 [Vanilla planifolia]